MKLLLDASWGILLFLFQAGSKTITSNLRDEVTITTARAVDRKQSLSWSFSPREDMTTILPKLEVLNLKNYAFQGPKWVPAEVGFPSLKYLLIEKSNLVHWEATVDQFPCLQKLFLKSCKCLEEIPFGVEDIGSLERFELHYCSEVIEVLQKRSRNRLKALLL